jgi:hypothetical protein
MTESNLEAPRPAEDKPGMSNPFSSKPDDKPKTEIKEDHLGMIAELASTLHNVSPSGAETVRDKILMHVGALQDPKAYNERVTAERKAEEEVEAARAKDRAANKQPVPEKAKVA